MEAIQFTLSTILMIAVGVILYFTARALPRITEEGEVQKASLLERWLTSEIPHRIDQALNNYMGKFFRKLKVYILRLDNVLTGKLKKMNMGLNSKPKIDFNEITGEKNGESNGSGPAIAEKD
ncbi:MAG TPA: hypothetical protein VJL32_03575 [Candidatus Paceibacterota bacterium]